MEILSVENNDVFEQTCDKCKTTFSYSGKDVHNQTFECPLCKKKLTPLWKERKHQSDDNRMIHDLSHIFHSKDVPKRLYSCNIGDVVSFIHSTYGNIMFDVCAKDYLVPETVTLVSRRCITNARWNKHANVNNYSKSSIRHWLNHDFLNGFSEGIQYMIKSPYWECHDGKDRIFLNDKITIPSITEMGVDDVFTNGVIEGTRFEKINIHHKFGGTVDGQNASEFCWTRTPCNIVSCCSHVFDVFGQSNGKYCVQELGVPVCFII